jgi:fibronectin-binding autotransporter adhesin
MFDRFCIRSSCTTARFSAIAVASSLLVGFLMAREVRADVSWLLPANQSGDWSAASNWGGAVPTVVDAAYIVNGGMATITQLGATCGTLSLGNNTGSGTVLMTAGNLSTVHLEYVANSGVGNFTQSGGTHTVSSLLYLGWNSGSSGTYNLSGSGLLSASEEFIGYSGSGGFTQTAGMHSVPLNGIYFGWNSGSRGTYNLSGGSLSSGNYEVIGVSGTGSFTQSGGTHSLYASAGDHSLILGDLSSDANGTYNLSGGSLSAPSEVIGNIGAGSFTQSGGTNTVYNAGYFLFFGYNPTGIGTYNLSGSGMLNVTPPETIGYQGTGVFTQSGGTHTAAGGLYLAAANGSAGTYNLNGGLLRVSALSKGGGTATFNFGGGTLGSVAPWSSSLNINLTGTAGPGTIDTTGGNISLSGNLTGSGGLTKLGSGVLTLNGVNTYSGSTTVDGGTLLFTSSQAIGGSGANVTVNYGATAAAGYPMDQSFLNRLAPPSSGVAALAADSSNALSLSGFAGLRLGALGNANYAGVLTPSAAIYRLGGGGGVLTVSGPLTGANSLDVGTNGTPVGTVVLAGAKTYTGSTQVSGGTLVVQEGSSSSSFTASNGGTLEFSSASINLGSTYARAITGGLVQYQNTSITGGFLRGPGSHVLLPGSANSFNATTINTGAVMQQLGNAAFLDVTNRGQVINSAPLTWDGGLNDGGSTLIVGNTATVSEWNNVGAIVVSNGGVLNNHATDLTSYGGGRITVNSSGTLNADSQSEGCALDLQDSLLVNNGTVAGTTNVGYGATVTGKGDFGPIHLSDGGTLAVSSNASPLASSLTVSGGRIAGSGESAQSATIHGADLVAPNPTDLLVLSGDLTGDGAITKLGAGTIMLTGNNSYVGGTVVTAGALIIGSKDAMPDGTSLTVGTDAAWMFISSAVAVTPGSTTAAVPEPSTLALIGAGAIGLAAFVRRRISKR